jgi:hypothetical protein
MELKVKVGNVKTVPTINERIHPLIPRAFKGLVINIF